MFRGRGAAYAPGMNAASSTPARAPRYPIHLPLRFRPSGDAEWVGGTSENVSVSGVLFTTAHALAVGSTLVVELLLAPDDGSTRIVTSATVVRGRARPTGGHDIAAAFTEEPAIRTGPAAHHRGAPESDT